MQRDGSVKCRNRLSRECNTKWQSFAAKRSHFSCFCGAKSKSCLPPACNLQLTQVNRRSKYWTKAGIKLYICPASLLIVIAQVTKSYFLPEQILLLHTHTHTHLSHLCAHFCGTRGTVWQLTPFFGKVQTLLSFRFWLNSFTLSLCFIVCLSAAQNGCMKATYTSISGEATFRWKHEQLKQ